MNLGLTVVHCIICVTSTKWNALFPRCVSTSDDARLV